MTKRGTIAIACLVLVAVAAVLVVILRPPSAATVSARQPEIVVALDAGHGGRDPGATAGDVLEKDINLAIVKRTQTLMDVDPLLKPYLTRTVDVFVALEERVRLALQAGAQVYVNVHVNSFSQPEVHGVETWVDTTRKDADPTWVLASMVQDAVSAATGARSRGIRTQESFLQRSTVPAVSLEVGYITNPDERARLLDPLYQDRIAAGIVTGVKQFLAWREANAPAVPSAAPASTPTRKP